MSRMSCGYRMYNDPRLEPDWETVIKNFLKWVGGWCLMILSIGLCIWYLIYYGDIN